MLIETGSKFQTNLDNLQPHFVAKCPRRQSLTIQWHNKCENPYSVQTYSILGWGVTGYFFTKLTQTNHSDFQNNTIHHVHIIHSEASNKISK